MAEVPEHLLARAAERKRQLEADRIRRLEVESELDKVELTPLPTRYQSRQPAAPIWYNEREVKKRPVNGGFFENIGRKIDAVMRKVLKHGV